MFGAIFGTAALLIVAMTAASVWRVDRSFSRYVMQLELARLNGLVQQLQRDREQTGDWRFVPSDPDTYRRWINRAMGGGGPRDDFRRPGPDEGARPPGAPLPHLGNPPAGANPDPPPDPPPGRRAPPDRLALMRRVTIFDADGMRLGGAPLEMQQTDTLPIVVRGQTVGHVGLQALDEPVASTERAFLREQWRDALIVGGAALLLSALVSLAFARHLRRPVRELVDGTRALASGSLSIRLDTLRSDEFGLITGNFNQMAMRLEQQERERREWLASTSHELRTPLTVLRALIEAMQEGIRQGDAATLQRLHDQVMSLARLVDDLYQLARHDAGNAQLERHALDPRAVIYDVVDAQRQRLAQAGIVVAITDHALGARITADGQRLAQLVHNLVENTLRYTDAPGRLQITLSLVGPAHAGRRWRAEFDDSAPGVAPAGLPRLFERFYRGEASRSRATGGSGLGLAICRAIAEEHGGQIDAQASPLGGVRITLSLPT